MLPSQPEESPSLPVLGHGLQMTAVRRCSSLAACKCRSVLSQKKRAHVYSFKRKKSGRTLPHNISASQMLWVFFLHFLGLKDRCQHPRQQFCLSILWVTLKTLLPVLSHPDCNLLTAWLSQWSGCIYPSHRQDKEWGHWHHK